MGLYNKKHIPKDSGNVEPIEFKSYINDQEDRIENAFNDIETVVTDTSSTLKDLLLKFGLIKDYVIEEGVNARGRYEKSAKGKLEQWGNDTKSVQPTGTAAGIAYQNAVRVTYPIAFYDTPEYVGIGIVRESGLIWSDLFDKTSTYCEAMVAGVSENARGRLNFHAKGRWKA